MGFSCFLLAVSIGVGYFRAFARRHFRSSGGDFDGFQSVIFAPNDSREDQNNITSCKHS
jgi:hypothetical protein